ncbi:hypothetical protein BDA99DRAFT_573493 [Phascolomyces articulosus]|uniref:SET domain-containing protein n=1 Tax=Phascolomyces articulosus TaxID=60185 RepID=A0AAD5JVW7_9FUNG|nr:hypothetical protein BDA99DRAFT_573493 [Phascolomyces articulosus]
MDLHFSLDDVSQYTRKLTPAHIDYRVWPPIPNESASWNKAHIEDHVDAKKHGSSVMSTQKISSGKVVIQEYPQIKHLDHSLVFYRCSQCFRRNADVKCRNKNCPWDLHYCNKKCEARHWSSSHRWLCRFPELSKYIDMTQENFQFHTGETPMILKSYFISNQAKIPSLVSNLDKHGLSDRKKYREKAQMIAAVLHLIRDNAVNELAEIQGQIRCNTIAIRETNHEWGVTEILGKAIYLSASKINHSCDPNAIAYFGKDPGHDPCLLRVRASRDIPPQEQICISYAFTAAKHEKEARQNSLQTLYFFHCQCGACRMSNEENYAAYIYQCPNCSKGRLAAGQVSCRDCKKRPDWMKIAMIEQKADTHVEKGQYVAAAKLQEIIYHKSALQWGEVMDKLGERFAEREDYEKAAKCVMASLKAVRDTFGATSIETSHELKKLSSLLFNGQNYDKAKSIVIEAIRVYKALGLDEQNGTEYKELEKVKKMLKNVPDIPFTTKI